jgi:hypothetical protein
MKRAVLLTGFNNWGKTTHIYNIFGQTRFYKGGAYSIHGVNASFTVESHSNDDVGEDRFIETVKDKISKAPPKAKDVFCAFCPTREQHNDSQRILTRKPFSSFDEIHLLLLRYKWDFHAELRIKEIKGHLSSVPNVHFFTVDADAAYNIDAQRCKAREMQIVSYLQSIYP